MSQAQDVTEHVNDLKRRYDTLIIIDSLEGVENRTQEEQEAVYEDALSLWVEILDTDKKIRLLSLRSASQSIPEITLEQYGELKDSIMNLFELMRRAQPDQDIGQSLFTSMYEEWIEEKHGLTPVFDFFFRFLDAEQGTEQWQRILPDEHSDRVLENVSEVLGASFFKPDDWLRNIRELTPLLGEKVRENIPDRLKIQLTEVYHGFCLGRYLPTIALCRMVLEYVLVERARKRDWFDPRDDEKKQPYKCLADLIEEMSHYVPSDITRAMKQIKHKGNKAIHPPKAFEEQYEPQVFRGLAKELVGLLRQVCEHLYLDRKV